jgi:hypothetical protein
MSPNAVVAGCQGVFRSDCYSAKRGGQDRQHNLHAHNMAPAGTPYVAFAEDASWWAPGALARVERWTRSTGRLLGAWPGGR